MSNVKERLLGAITVMDEENAQKLWKYILEIYDNKWDKIEEEDPDEIDLRMIHDAENDPDCQILATPEEARRVLG